MASHRASQRWTAARTLRVVAVVAAARGAPRKPCEVIAGDLGIDVRRRAGNGDAPCDRAGMRTALALRDVAQPSGQRRVRALGERCAVRRGARGVGMRHCKGVAAAMHRAARYSGGMRELDRAARDRGGAKVACNTNSPSRCVDLPARAGLDPCRRPEQRSVRSSDCNKLFPGDKAFRPGVAPKSRGTPRCGASS